MQVVKLSRAELEQFAREQYAAHFGAREAAAPKFVNAAAVAEVNAPRSFVWGGLGYWAPPLSYEAGVRLMAAAHALRDLRTAGVVDLRRARKAAGIVRAAVSRRWRRTRSAPPAFGHTPADIEALAVWLLHVPDDAPAPPASGPVTVDMMDNRMAFRRAFGAYPATWAEYVYGMRHLSRDVARTDLRGAVSGRMAGADKKAWSEWVREVRTEAGV
jgi:hypothetical protein